LTIEKWVDINLIAKYIDLEASMDINIYIGDFNIAFTIAGNPFHHKNNSDIIFCKNCHAFVLNFKIFNKAISLPEIEGLRFDPDFNFDFSLPTCIIG
jgi:hypothetical protein